MKYLLPVLAAVTSTHGFAPASSLSKVQSTLGAARGPYDNGQWYWDPWGGITEETFYPQSQAGNRMFFFPSPKETVGAASREGSGAPPKAPSLPQGADAAAMPEMDRSPMPEVESSKVSASA
eukprot:scaffold674_cov126-Cylindrotheca_fusiformis.AAC.6